MLSFCQDTLSARLCQVKAFSPLSKLFLPQSGCPWSFPFICKSFVQFSGEGGVGAAGQLMLPPVPSAQEEEEG